MRRPCRCALARRSRSASGTRADRAATRPLCGPAVCCPATARPRRTEGVPDLRRRRTNPCAGSRRWTGHGARRREARGRSTGWHRVARRRRCHSRRAPARPRSRTRGSVHRDRPSARRVLRYRRLRAHADSAQPIAGCFEPCAPAPGSPAASAGSGSPAGPKSFRVARPLSRTVRRTHSASHRRSTRR